MCRSSSSSVVPGHPAARQSAHRVRIGFHERPDRANRLTNHSLESGNGFLRL